MNNENWNSRKVAIEDDYRSGEENGRSRGEAKKGSRRTQFPRRATPKRLLGRADGAILESLEVLHND